MKFSYLFFCHCRTKFINCLGQFVIFNSSDNPKPLKASTIWTLLDAAPSGDSLMLALHSKAMALNFHDQASSTNWYSCQPSGQYYSIQNQDISSRRIVVLPLRPFQPLFMRHAQMASLLVLLTAPIGFRPLVAR